MYYYKYVNPADEEFFYSSKEELIIGEDAEGDCRFFVPCEAPTAHPTLQEIRKKRNSFLSGCDWTQMPDAPLTESQKELWKIYRQQLRDVPETFVEGIPTQWPTPP